MVGAVEQRLGSRDEALIDEWKRQQVLFLSPMSAWEVAQKVAAGKLDLAHDISSVVSRSVERGRFTLLSLTVEILIAANRLPGIIHGDPVDGILVATARAYDLTLVTHDTELRRYAKQGHLRVHAV